MNLSSVLQYLLFVGIVTAMVKPLGGYMERVFSGRRTALDELCRPVERVIYRIGGVDSSREMTASTYATCFLLFGAISTLLLFLILRLQNYLPWFIPLISPLACPPILHGIPRSVLAPRPRGKHTLVKLP